MSLGDRWRLMTDVRRDTPDPAPVEADGGI